MVSDQQQIILLLECLPIKALSLTNADGHSYKKPLHFSVFWRPAATTWQVHTVLHVLLSIIITHLRSTLVIKVTGSLFGVWQNRSKIIQIRAVGKIICFLPARNLRPCIRNLIIAPPWRKRKLHQRYYNSISGYTIRVNIRNLSQTPETLRHNAHFDSKPGLCHVQYLADKKCTANVDYKGCSSAHIIIILRSDILLWCTFYRIVYYKDFLCVEWSWSHFTWFCLLLWVLWFWAPLLVDW